MYTGLPTTDKTVRRPAGPRDVYRVTYNRRDCKDDLLVLGMYTGLSTTDKTVRRPFGPRDVYRVTYN